MPKTPKMETMLDNMAKQMFGRSRKDAACVDCGSDKINPNDFKDDLSRKEFNISHMCQICQEEIFGNE